MLPSFGTFYDVLTYKTVSNTLDSLKDRILQDGKKSVLEQKINVGKGLNNNLEINKLLQ